MELRNDENNSSSSKFIVSQSENSVSLVKRNPPVVNGLCPENKSVSKNHKCKMGIVFIILLLVTPFLLLSTYLLTARRKSFKKIFIAHTIVFAIYMTFVINYSKLLTGHDEYGIGQLGLGIVFVIIHVIIGFAHGLYITLKKKI